MFENSGLVLCDHHRIECAVPVAREIQNHLAAVSRHRLLTLAIATIGRPITPLRCVLSALLIEMNVQLCTQRPFRKRLGQLRQIAGLAKQVVGRTPFHQSVKQVFINAQTRISSSRKVPRQRTKFRIVPMQEQDTCHQ